MRYIGERTEGLCGDSPEYERVVSDKSRSRWARRKTRARRAQRRLKHTARWR